MFKGIIFFEQGGIQVIGEIASYAAIITTLEGVLPQLHAEEKSRLLSRMSDDELKQILADRQKVLEG